jgi:hypothetical protein
MKFDDAQKRHIDCLIEGRLQRERRAHERSMQAERNRHAAEVLTLQIEIARLQSERSILQRLTDKWFRGRSTSNEHQHESMARPARD